MNKRVAITLAFCLASLGLVVVLFKGFGRNPREVPFMLRGQPAPEFFLKRLDNGEPVRLSSLQGKPVVINFWASWCGPCRQEHPVLEWAGREFGDEVQFLGIVFEDSEDNAKTFLTQFGDPGYPQLFDPSSPAAVAYGVAGVPETYFIDASGVIVDKHVGPVNRGVMISQIDQLLKRGGSQPVANGEGGGR